MISGISRHRRSIILLFVIALASCSKHEPVPPPIVNVNPSPQKNYVVTIHIDDTTSGISDVQVVKSYGISNIEECSPLDYTRSLGGSYQRPIKELSSQFNNTDTHVFTTDISADYFLNENYYGMKNCKWQPQLIVFRFNRYRVKYAALLDNNDFSTPKKFQFECQILSENKISGISETCKNLSGSNFEKYNHYFTLTININIVH